MSIIYSFNELSDETIKDYPFYVGYSVGLVIDQRLKEVDGEFELDDLYVVTSGLPFTEPHEVVGFLRELADELEEVELEDDQLD